MKNFLLILAIAATIVACSTTQNTMKENFGTNEKLATNDTVRIANDELEYEVIIIDPGFNGWAASYARPRNYYSQSYLEARNQDWVIGWNNFFYRGSDLFLMPIDYDRRIDYGYEVNYLLFNYLTYYQLKNNIRLGTFAARI